MLRGMLCAGLLSLSSPGLAGTGSWTLSRQGCILTTGQVSRVSPVMSPGRSFPPGTTVTLLSWQIRLLTPPPPGLEIMLCDPAHCLPLPALRGNIAPPRYFSPYGPFRFVYSVHHKGRLERAVHILNNQLTVNYKGN